MSFPAAETEHSLLQACFPILISMGRREPAPLSDTTVITTMATRCSLFQVSLMVPYVVTSGHPFSGGEPEAQRGDSRQVTRLEKWDQMHAQGEGARGSRGVFPVLFMPAAPTSIRR